MDARPDVAAIVAEMRAIETQPFTHPATGIVVHYVVIAPEKIAGWANALSAAPEPPAPAETLSEEDVRLLQRSVWVATNNLEERGLAHRVARYDELSTKLRRLRAVAWPRPASGCRWQDGRTACGHRLIVSVLDGDEITFCPFCAKPLDRTPVVDLMGALRRSAENAGLVPPILSAAPEPPAPAETLSEVEWGDVDAAIRAQGEEWNELADKVRRLRSVAEPTEAEKVVMLLLAELPELWGDHVVEGRLPLVVEAEAVERGLSVMRSVAWPRPASGAKFEYPDGSPAPEGATWARPRPVVGDQEAKP